jgi:hypothetical protein
MGLFYHGECVQKLTDIHLFVCAKKTEDMIKIQIIYYVKKGTIPKSILPALLDINDRLTKETRIAARKISPVGIARR